MKNFTLQFLLFAFLFSPIILFSQPCLNGRYANEVFPSHTLTSNITYGANTSFSGANTTLKLDFYEPSGDTEMNRPLIIWVHGGSFIGGSKTDQDMQELSIRFAKKGYACASIDYRLGFFPIDSANAVKAVVRAVQDLRASLRFFYKDKQTTDTYKIDTNRIYVGGSSAGAITALHVAYLDDPCEISGYLNSTLINQLGGLEGNSGNPGYSSDVQGVINLCGALAKYVWLEPGDVPLCSLHGTSDGTVKYNRGVVNPGTPLMYLDGSRMLHDRACAINVQSNFYTFPGAPHVPYLGTGSTALAYMDTTERFVRDFMVEQLGCTETPLQLANTPLQLAILYPSTYCDGSSADEACTTGVPIIENEWSVSLFPNPSSEISTLQVDKGLFKSVRILDFSGKVLVSMEHNSMSVNINTDLLPNGQYLVMYMLDNYQTGYKKLTVQ